MYRTSAAWTNLGRCDAIAALATIAGTGSGSGSGASQWQQSSSLGQIDLACLAGAEQLGLLTPGMLVQHFFYFWLIRLVFYKMMFRTSITSNTELV